MSQSARNLISIAGAQENAKHTFAEEEKTAFVEFINLQLANDADLKAAGYIPIDPSGDSIFKVVQDGILLAKLVNVAKPDTIVEKTLNKKLPLNKYKVIENCNQVIGACKMIGCSVVNIGSQDIIDGRPILIFSLMWQCIRIKLMSKINLVDHPELYRLLEDGETLEDFLKLPPEQILLRWVNYHLKAANHPRKVTNFTTDIKDAENYTVLLAQIAPKLCNRDPLNVEGEARAEQVLQGSEKLGVKRFITPKDIVNGNQRLNLSFVAELFNTWPALAPLDNDELKAKLKLLIEDDSSNDSREEKAFRAWINNIGIATYVNSLFTDLNDGNALLQVEDKLQPGIVAWLKVSKPPVKMVFKRNENCNLAVNLGKSLGCSLVGIAGQDIEQCNKQYTLAIVWQLRRKHLLNFLSSMSAKTGKEYTDQSLLADANAKVAESGKATKITSFNDPSLKNSRFLLDLIGTIEPRAIDEELYHTGTADEDLKFNAQYAIAAARKIGASVFLIWEDIVEVKPKMILTFIGAVLAEGHAVLDE